MDLKDVFVPYDSPIDVIFNRTVDNIMAAFNNSIDDGVVECVVKAGFNVDKDKLVEVFTQDKRRYEEAYRKGYAQAMSEMPEIVRCPDCLYNKNCISTEEGIEQDGFCKWGKRKDGDGDG